MTITGQPTSSETARHAIEARIERWRRDVVGLSHVLHADPELGGEEFRAAQLTRSLLGTAGFVLSDTQPTAPTAFCAHAGTGGFVVVLCVEYDALPGIGHGCGHNVNAATAVGAAIGLAAVADELGITVRVLGTPAEETTGGKVDLVGEGWFEDAAIALMAHAAGTDSVGGTSLALSCWDIEYMGRGAHAAVAPEHGVNALDALLVAQTAIGLARQQLPAASIVSVVTHEGGSAVNVIPECSRATVEMRSPDIAGLRVIEDRIERCLESGAVASRCALSITSRGNTFAELRQDPVLAAAYRDAMASRGRTVDAGDSPVASTDMGNVSQVVPSIHPMLGYDVADAVHHTAEFTAHGVGPSADAAVVDGAFGLAMTGVTAALNRHRFDGVAELPRR